MCEAPGSRPLATPTGPDSILSILESEPQLSSLNHVISYLFESFSVGQREGFNILLPSPKSFKIIFLLANNVIPSFWPTFKLESTKADKKSKRGLLRILRSTSGLSATLASIRALTQEIKRTSAKQTDRLSTLCDFLQSLLQGDDFLLDIWQIYHHCESQTTKADLLLKESVQLITSGRVVSVSAEANILLQEQSSTVRPGDWTSEGGEYAQWLGLNLLCTVTRVNDDVWDIYCKRAVGITLSKSLNLGYNDRIVASLYKQLIHGDASSLSRLRSIMQNLSGHEQKIVLFSIIHKLSQRLTQDSQPLIDGTAGLISALCEGGSVLREHLATWLASPSAESIKYSHSLHRAVLRALAVDPEQVKNVMWRALAIFSDGLFIKHSPIIHQEVNTQIVMMLLGSVYSNDPRFLEGVTKSSVYLSSISNHLAASSVRSKFLGMIVAFTVSEVLDKPEARLKFTSDGFDTDDWNWYKSIFWTRDHIGSIEDLRSTSKNSQQRKLESAKKLAIHGATHKPKPPIQSSKIISIEEVEDESDIEVASDADDDLPVYAKPESDMSDDDDDPTLVQRNRPVAPVYIRELLAGLRDIEDHDKHTLALEHAASLIRRKAEYGTEVKDHIHDLAVVILGLKDRWEKDDFTNLRLQILIAILVVDPVEMGPKFAQSFYSGDYSLSQRGTMLTAIGLAAREIAGAGQDDVSLTTSKLSEGAFPSKRLPGQLHQYYAAQVAAPMDKLTQELSRSIIQPLAASAADAATGPKALKVRTFSSRLDVEKRRTKPSANPLSKLVAKAFFFPLTARWQIQVNALGDHAPQASQMLVNLLLKTLSLVLHAAGPANPSLPQLTKEFWDFLLDMRRRADDKTVLEALLFSFLMLLEVNTESDRRLAEEHAKQLFETQEWANEVLERTNGDGEEENRCKMLAAGIVVRCREIIEKHQRLLVGDVMRAMN